VLAIQSKNIQTLTIIDTFIRVLIGTEKKNAARGCIIEETRHYLFPIIPLRYANNNNVKSKPSVSTGRPNAASIKPEEMARLKGSLIAFPIFFKIDDDSALASPVVTSRPVLTSPTIPRNRR